MYLKQVSLNMFLIFFQQKSFIGMPYDSNSSDTRRRVTHHSYRSLSWRKWNRLLHWRLDDTVTIAMAPWSIHQTCHCSYMHYNCANAGFYEELSIISSYQQKAELTTEDKSTSGMAMILGFCFNLLFCCFVIVVLLSQFGLTCLRLDRWGIGWW